MKALTVPTPAHDSKELLALRAVLSLRKRARRAKCLAQLALHHVLAHEQGRAPPASPTTPTEGAPMAPESPLPPSPVPSEEELACVAPGTPEQAKLVPESPQTQKLPARARARARSRARHVPALSLPARSDPLVAEGLRFWLEALPAASQHTPPSSNEQEDTPLGGPLERLFPELDP